MFLEFCTAEKLGQQRWHLYTVLLQIHSADCLQKIILTS